MKEAIRIAKEFSEQTQTEEQRIKGMDELKPAINNLLHMYLPEDMTLKEVEIIAMTFNQIIWQPKEFIRAVDDLV
jgi:hypothetical protein